MGFRPNDYSSTLLKNKPTISTRRPAIVERPKATHTPPNSKERATSEDDVHVMDTGNIKEKKTRVRETNQRCPARQNIIITRHPGCCLLSARKWEPRNYTVVSWARHGIGNKSKTNRSKVSASRYALNTSHAINTSSPKNRTQLRNVDQEISRCTKNSAVNSKLDCHAWNLYRVSIRGQRLTPRQ